MLRGGPAFHGARLAPPPGAFPAFPRNVMRAAFFHFSIAIVSIGAGPMAVSVLLLIQNPMRRNRSMPTRPEGRAAQDCRNQRNVAIFSSGLRRKSGTIVISAGARDRIERRLQSDCSPCGAAAIPDDNLDIPPQTCQTVDQLTPDIPEPPRRMLDSRLSESLRSWRLSLRQAPAADDVGNLGHKPSFDQHSFGVREPQVAVHVPASFMNSVPFSDLAFTHCPVSRANPAGSACKALFGPSPGYAQNVTSVSAPGY